MITLHLVMSLDLSCVPDQGLENSRIIEIKKYFSYLVYVIMHIIVKQELVSKSWLGNYCLLLKFSLALWDCVDYSFLTREVDVRAVCSPSVCPPLYPVFIHRCSMTVKSTGFHHGVCVR